MIVPILEPGVKQWDDVSRVQFKRGQIQSLVTIAVRTGLAKVFKNVAPAVLHRVDMFNMEHEEGS